MTRIYGVTGMPLAGKTTAARMVADEGYAVLDMGDVVRQEMEKRDIPAGNEGEFVNMQREKHGMDAIAKLSAPYLEEMLGDEERIVITGMRGWSEKLRFEEETGADVQVIALWASASTRKRRREERRREEDLKGQGFHERDMREIENGIAKLMALSNHMIINDDIGLEGLERKIKEIVA